MELAPQSTVDRYTVEAKLGEGGLAVVYKVRHNRLGTLHAMKVLKVATQSIQERLLLEGRVQASLNHPNVVAVTDIVDVGTSPGLVMQFVDGASLDELILRERLAVDQIDALARGILNGVGAAHAAGLIHRDLKPANILLEIRAGRFVPKITDFGLAKMFAGDGASAQRTRTGMAMGTPSYMAPEQIESAKDVDARADVYSVGAILYELISGQRAYDDASMLRIFNAVVSGERRPLAGLRPDVPARWIAAVDAAMHVDRNLRPATCEALLELWSGERVLPADADSQWDEGMVERARTRGAGASLPVSRAVTATAPSATAPHVTTHQATFDDPPSSIAEITPVGRTTAASMPGTRAGLAVGGLALLLGGLVLAAFLTVGVAGIWWASRADGPDRASVAPAPQPPAPEPAAPSPAPVVPAPVLLAPEVPAPTPVPEPTPAPDIPPPGADPAIGPAPVRPRPEPPVRPPPTNGAVRVGVSGDASQVNLVQKGRRFRLPAEVPPGEYSMEAVFPDEGTVNTGSATVRAGSPATVHCSDAFYSCEIR